LKEKFPEIVHRTVLCYPELDAAEFDSISDECVVQKRRELGLSNESVVLCVGRIQEVHKGFDVALAAISRVVREFPNVINLIVGPGSPDALRQVAKQLNLNERVRFMGEVSRDDLLKLYRMSDILLMPGRRLKNGVAEGFGMVYIEAALSDCAVVGGIDGGAPEAIVDGVTGLLASGDSPEEVATAVIRLLGNPEEQATLAAAARKWAFEEFCRGKYAALFNSAVIKITDRQREMADAQM
jgi:phosphatidylinositol alpha-1,6-mannosyltransferase